MEKAVLISIQPGWVERILDGEKTLEVRKTNPKLAPPFKCYIYCTKGTDAADKLWVLREKIRKDYYGLAAACADLEKQPENHSLGNGKVVAEFVCDQIAPIVPAMEPYGIYDVDDDFVAQTCLANGALWDYGKGATLYGWHVSKLKVYDTPKQLSGFMGLRETKFGYAPAEIKRPPQSWCYVEELK